ncbi:flagellar hook-basal body complex protein [Metaclostridioides mangenotii]|jgi:flagellar hook protein FlgE|uniref:Flagellar hook protein FlgE n=1 Tax=Metaclostridioides mangenotii TaxID=1540 RepID=A0ABS4ECI4_9FIRM|nr:flagellar hook-basal body complex protein [Clostridioides mangenotii]MBP1855646.1 flagellar hook protein FlgE [Clostridioides mangenotii]
MIKAMYSGISGIKANQTKLDVVGNNVANVSTVAFKKSTARTTDSFYQTMIYSSAPTAAMGGTNLGQVGIGTQVSSIVKNMLQGGLQPTGITSDLAIDGEGYFPVVRNGQVLYTRDGSFGEDEQGRLVNSSGFILQGKITPEGGAAADGIIEIPLQSVSPKDGTIQDVVSYTISKDGVITYSLADGQTTDKVYDIPPDTPSGSVGTVATNMRTQQVQIYAFKNPAGLDAQGGNLFSPSANSGDPQIEGASGVIKQGSIEMSNVDLAEEFTEMIVSSRAFQASSKIITTSDEILQDIINLKR